MRNKTHLVVFSLTSSIDSTGTHESSERLLMCNNLFVYNVNPNKCLKNFESKSCFAQGTILSASIFWPSRELLHSIDVVVSIYAYSIFYFHPTFKSRINYTLFPKMPYVPQGQLQRPSCWTKIKTGFTLGMCVGMTAGVLFGGFSAWRMGLRGREMLGTIGKVMMQSGGTFGTFMAIGSGIRC